MIIEFVSVSEWEEKKKEAEDFEGISLRYLFDKRKRKRGQEREVDVT